MEETGGHPPHGTSSVTTDMRAWPSERRAWRAFFQHVTESSFLNLRLSQKKKFLGSAPSPPFRAPHRGPPTVPDHLPLKPAPHPDLKN